MSYGNLKTSALNIASGASTSAELILGSRAYSQLTVLVPTMSTAAQIAVYSSQDGSAYYKVFHPIVNSSATQCNAMIIASNVGASGGFAQIPVAGLSRLKLVASDVVSGGVAFTVIGID